MSTQQRSAIAQPVVNLSAIILLLAIGLTGCSGNQNQLNTDGNGTPTPSLTPTPSPSPSPSPTPSPVPLSMLGIPVAWMTAPDRKPEMLLSIGPGPSDCPVGMDCRKFTYKAGAGWAGIGWWPAKCGSSGTPAAFAEAKHGTCGVNVLQQGRLKSVDRLSFQARGEKGGEVIGFQVGADDMLPMPKIGPYKIKLTTDWQRQKIDLKDADLTNAVALFIWVATDEDNPKGAVFYLDDIKFEGVR